MFVAAVEIKTPDKHVEAAIPVILGRGFNSLRLHWAPMGAMPASDALPRCLRVFLFIHGSGAGGVAGCGTGVVGGMVASASRRRMWYIQMSRLSASAMGQW